MLKYFDNQPIIMKFLGLILFIEEDHYMAQDFIHVLKVMQRTCPQSKIFSLGIHSADNVFSRKPKVYLYWLVVISLLFV